MKHVSNIVICFYLSLPLVGHSFVLPLIGDAGSPPDLDHYTRGQRDTILDVRLNIGIKEDAPHFAIDGFKFQLNDKKIYTSHNSTDSANGNSQHIPLPGSDGPRPHLSSGARNLHVVQDGTFVNMKGLQTVELRGGCWEMVWRDEAAAGLIICGFNLTKDASRNGLVFKRGNVYLTFPVWSKEGLEKMQSLKLDAQAKYKEFEIERNDQLEKMSNTPNVLMKALHYRNAVAAATNMDSTGLHLLVDVPSQNDVLEIGGELQLVRTGTIWSKNGPFESHHQKLLGSATLT